MRDKRLLHNIPSRQCEVVFNARDTKPDYVLQKINKVVPLWIMIQVYMYFIIFLVNFNKRCWFCFLFGEKKGVVCINAERK